MVRWWWCNVWQCDGNDAITMAQYSIAIVLLHHCHHVMAEWSSYCRTITSWSSHHRHHSMDPNLMVWWYDSKLPGPIQIPYFSGNHYTNMYQIQGSEVLGWALDRKTSNLTLTLDLWFFVKKINTDHLPSMGNNYAKFCNYHKSKYSFSIGLLQTLPKTSVYK